MRVIVTGAAGALGRAVVARFAGADRVACLARAAGDAGPSLAWFACADLAEPALATPAIERAAAWAGGIDALIHVAGSFAWQTVEQSGPEDWWALHRANVQTAQVVVRAALPHLVDGGAIVTIGAAAARRAGAGMGGYAAAKSGLLRLTEALAEELRPRGIRANAVLPAIIDTPANRAAMPDADPAGWTSPAAIAEAIHFLASPAARAINGAAVPVTNPA